MGLNESLCDPGDHSRRLSPRDGNGSFETHPVNVYQGPSFWFRVSAEQNKCPDDCSKASK